MYGDKHNAGDGLCGLGDSELFHKHEDADDGEDAYDLDADVDPVAALRGVWSVPKEEDEEERLDDELAASLRQAVAVCAGDDAAFGEHVDDGGHEEPPSTLLVGVVEQAVFDPRLFVLIQRIRVAFGFLILADDVQDPNREVG